MSCYRTGFSLRGLKMQNVNLKSLRKGCLRWPKKLEISGDDGKCCFSSSQYLSMALPCNSTEAPSRCFLPKRNFGRSSRNCLQQLRCRVFRIIVDINRFLLIRCIRYWNEMVTLQHLNVYPTWLINFTKREVILLKQSHFWKLGTAMTRRWISVDVDLLFLSTRKNVHFACFLLAGSVYLITYSVH